MAESPYEVSGDQPRAALDAEAANPATSPERLAELAYHHPSMRAVVAANPSAYPGLIEWIRTYGQTPSGTVAAGSAIAAVTVANSAASGTQPFAAAKSARTSGSVGSRVLVAVGVAVYLLTVAIPWPFVVRGVGITLEILAYSLLVVAIVLLPTTVARRVVAGVMVGVVGILPAIMSITCVYFYLDWLWFVSYGVFVLAWLIARERSGWTYLFTFGTMAAVFGWNYLVADIVPLNDTEVGSALFLMLRYGGFIGISVGACWLARAASPDRNEQGVRDFAPFTPAGLDPGLAPVRVPVRRPIGHVLSAWGRSASFAVTAVTVAIVIGLAGVSTVPSAWFLITFAYLVYVGALLVLGATRLRKLISAGMVGAVCVVPAVLNAVFPGQFVTMDALLAFAGSGVLVLGWLIARERDAMSYLLAPAAVVAAFGWYVAVVTLVNLTGLFGGTALIGLVSAGGTVGIIVGACLIARGMTLRRWALDRGGDGRGGPQVADDSPPTLADDRVVQR
ncbi:MAG TPA: hypothetical protein VIJ18_08760 [Microbacteriaceae bacterium]